MGGRKTLPVENKVFPALEKFSDWSAKNFANNLAKNHHAMLPLKFGEKTTMTPTIDTTCHACGKEYVAPEKEALSFDICHACRTNRPLLAIVIDDDTDDPRYAAGFSHCAERILDEHYTAYCEFSDDEWNALTDDQRQYAAELSAIADGKHNVFLDSQVPTVLAEFREVVARYVANLQALWTDVTARKVAKVNFRFSHTPAGVVYREWPWKFDIHINPVSVEELKASGVIG